MAMCPGCRSGDDAGIVGQRLAKIPLYYKTGWGDSFAS